MSGSIYYPPFASLCVAGTLDSCELFVDRGELDTHTIEASAFRNASLQGASVPYKKGRSPLMKPSLLPCAALSWMRYCSSSSRVIDHPSAGHPLLNPDHAGLATARFDNPPFEALSCFKSTLEASASHLEFLVVDRQPHFVSARSVTSKSPLHPSRRRIVLTARFHSEPTRRCEHITQQVLWRVHKESIVGNPSEAD